MFSKLQSFLSNKRKKTGRKSFKSKKGYHFFEEKISKKNFKKRRKNLISIKHIQIPRSVQAKNKTYIMLTCAIVIVAGGVFLLFSPFFRVSDIYIFRQDSIINIDQAYGNIDYIRGKNIFFLDTSEIAGRLQKSQKSISSIQFDVDFPHHLNIHIGSYPALFQTDNYLILSNGVVVSKDTKEYIGVPFLSTPENIEDYAIFGNTLNIQDLKNLDTLLKEGKKNILGFHFDNIKYYIKEKEALIYIGGSIFIFDLSNQINNQIEKLAIYEKEKGSIYEKKYIYVDVRIPEKLFLCPLESEYVCRENMKHIYGDSIFEEISTEPSELQQ